MTGKRPRLVTLIGVIYMAIFWCEALLGGLLILSFFPVLPSRESGIGFLPFSLPLLLVILLLVYYPWHLGLGLLRLDVRMYESLERDAWRTVLLVCLTGVPLVVILLFADIVGAIMHQNGLFHSVAGIIGLCSLGMLILLFLLTDPCLRYLGKAQIRQAFSACPEMRNAEEK